MRGDAPIMPIRPDRPAVSRRPGPSKKPLRAWTKLSGLGKTCFIVRDASKQALAFVYCEDEPGRRAAAKLLTRREER
jgi:hypothetical protein